jgi:ABC-type oligopeptide transport system substrate-binding subunit
VNYPRETSQIFKSLVLFFGFNMQREPFDNVHVRRAFAAAFDNVSFVNDTLQGQGIPMIHFAPPGTFGAPPIDEIGVGYDLEFARAQLVEAGHPDCHGFPQVNLAIWRERYFPEDAIRKWEENLNCPEGTIILSTSEAGEGLGELMDTTDIIYMGWGSDYPDETNWVGDFLPCDRSLTFFQRTCNEIDDLIEQASVETNLNARIDLYRQIEEAFFSTEGVFPIAPVLMAANYYGDHTWLDRTQALLGAEEFYNWTLDMEAKLDVMGE